MMSGDKLQRSINDLNKLNEYVNKNIGNMQLLGKGGYIDVKSNYEALCQNIVDHREDYCQKVLGGQCREEDNKRLNELSALCNDVVRGFDDKMKAKITGMYNAIRSYDDERIEQERIKNQKQVDEITKRTQLRALSLSQEQNIYKSKLIYTMGALSIATLILILMLFKTFGT